jgi:SAM-dependent methyltransferase
MTSQQTWNPERYARNARFVAELGLPVVDLLDPQPGERILDLGCGDGVLTQTLVERGCRVVAVDQSPEQVTAARRLGLDARVADARALGFGPAFDAVFSNAVLHWLPRPEDAFRGAHRALVPGGRFVAECGGEGCVETIRRALVAGLDRRGLDGASHVPWTFLSEAEARRRLEACGFEVETILLFPRPTPLPGDVAGWIETFAEAFTKALPEAERPCYLVEVRDELAPRLRDASGTWVADYVRLRFRARRPRS